jgi:hypothetical protein
MSVTGGQVVPEEGIEPTLCCQKSSASRRLRRRGFVSGRPACAGLHVGCADMSL